MDKTELNARCVELYNHPRVRNMMWNARMFWDFGRKLNPTNEDLTTPRVDRASWRSCSRPPPGASPGAPPI